MITEIEKEFLKSKKIVRNNIIRYNKLLVDKIDKLSIEYNVDFSEMIYLILNGDNILCANCKIKRPKFISNKSGYKKYCSSTCSNSHIDTKINKEKVILEKYGVKNVSQSILVKNKISKAYKDKSVEIKKEINEKVKNTMFEKYGYTSNFIIPEVISKRNEILKDDKTSTKRKNTCLEKYGVDNTSKLESVKKKFNDTCLENWGSIHFKKSEKFKFKELDKHLIKLNIYHSQYDLPKINKLSDLNYNMTCTKCNSVFDISINAYNIRKNQNLDICIICNPILYNRSLGEIDLFNFIKENYKGEIIQGYRLSKEVDIYLPELKIGFEYNGVFWHSEQRKDNAYHYEKFKYFQENNINLIQIWEDDWLYKKNIIKSIINNKIGNSKRIFGRKTVIKEVSNKDSIIFLNDNHIQGWCVSKIRYGLYYNDELISIMTFGQKRKNLGNISSNNDYELLRFCNKLNYSIIGGASKLFTKFINRFTVNSIISYSKNDYSSGNLYKKIGFEFDSETKPNYYWVVCGIRENRYNWRKDKLVKMGYDSNLTEVKIMHSNGNYRCFDSGNKKWLYKNIF